ncbi:MAG: type III pantothenate kinase [Bacteroidales bacterium]|nr:type III pantothenate kinase [Bacteroidales bacterium]
MNLIIDQGNTICKLAFFKKEGEEILELLTCPELSVSFLSELIRRKHPESCILSSVKILTPEITDFLRANVGYFLLLGPQTSMPITNAYKTPQTLGLDRVAAAVGARSLQPGKPLLVIDMGTAITYDFVSEEGIYLGGNIAPGLQMRLKALNYYTDKLPMVEPVSGFAPMGTDTQTAIRAGVMQGIVYEVEGYFQDLQQKHPELFVFLTGGDLIYFDGKLKNSIFVCKNLVLIGLNRILYYNVHS